MRYAALALIALLPLAAQADPIAGFYKRQTVTEAPGGDRGAPGR
jgi:hypothetical protein